ncbi:MAG: adenylosuccinate lyase [Actinobacteria bacterium]|nr:adenylosuccinate lyase [Actinomycetota bacterium]
MIERYSRPEMAGVFSDETRFAHWLEIEILAVEARVEMGEVPASDLKEIKAKASFDVERIKDLEKKTRHDVAAFLDNVAENVGEAARHLHYGMTSSDILDTALALQLRDASNLLMNGINRLIRSVIVKAREHAGTLMVARTHGIHAEPTTFGLKLAGWAFELSRGRERLELARDAISVGKISGVVGTYSQLPPEVERFVCERLGLHPDPASTQVIARDRHAEFVSTLAIVAAAIERIATEIRHLARTEVREVEEAFAEGEQKGSSAMPHKRNPVRTERLTGLARVVRAAVVPSLENIALWHERDISHSSVERILLPDACMALDFMLVEAADVVENLQVFPQRMRANLDQSFGLVYSQSLLLALIDAGLTRDEAYRTVQEAAMEAWNTETQLAEVISKRPEVSGRLSAEDIDRSFDESRYLSHAGEVIARLDRLERP